MDDHIVVGCIILVIGGFITLRPDLVLRFQVWVQRVVMGATYVPSTRTEHIVRALGVAFVLLGFLVVTRAIP